MKHPDTVWPTITNMTDNEQVFPLVGQEPIIKNIDYGSGAWKEKTLAESQKLALVTGGSYEKRRKTKCTFLVSNDKIKPYYALNIGAELFYTVASGVGKHVPTAFLFIAIGGDDGHIAYVSNDGARGFSITNFESNLNEEVYEPLFETLLQGVSLSELHIVLAGKAFYLFEPGTVNTKTTADAKTKKAAEDLRNQIIEVLTKLKIPPKVEYPYHHQGDTSKTDPKYKKAIDMPEYFKMYNVVSHDTYAMMGLGEYRDWPLSA